jgi:hypothetical protein
VPDVARHRYCWNSVSYHDVPRDAAVALRIRGRSYYVVAWWSGAFGCFVAPRYAAADLVHVRDVTYWSFAAPGEASIVLRASNMHREGTLLRWQTYSVFRGL